MREHTASRVRCQQRRTATSCENRAWTLRALGSPLSACISSGPTERGPLLWLRPVPGGSTSYDAGVVAPPAAVLGPSQPAPVSWFFPSTAREHQCLPSPLLRGRMGPD